MARQTRKRTVDELPSLSDAQLEIMDIIWDEGETTVGRVWKRLVVKRPIARNTVQTVMVRLEDRGWLTHRAEGPKKFFYAATVGRKRTLRGMVEAMVETAFGGSADGLVCALLEGRGVNADEAERIRRMIDKARKDGQ